MNYRALIALSMLPLGLLQACSSMSGSAASSFESPKVILIIGDGMDDQQITIARNYLVGSGGRLLLDSMPFRGVVQIQAVEESDPSQPLYVSDSANTATSIATGGITSPARIATTPGSDRRLETIVELAQAAGLESALVTTSSLTDATPASFITHINQRGCQGPEEMVSVRTRFGMETSINCSAYLKHNGGPGSISEQLAASGVNVLLGGGSNYFDQAGELNENSTVAQDATANGYQLVRDTEELARVESSMKILGIFSPDTMPVRLRGEDNAAAQRLVKIDGEVQMPAAFSCEPNPQFLGMPSLSEMTAVALNHLDEDKGFFLMVESASIDKQSHARRPCGSIGELEQLNEALALALDYAKTNPETLVLVTADHSHAAQLVDPAGNFLPVGYASPGFFARVKTLEGGIMGINYATNDSPVIEYHTGAQIPIYASGPGIDSIPSFIRQTQIFGILKNHLGLQD